MKSSTITALALALLAPTTLTLAQSSEEDYINSVCSPNTTVTSPGALPPCISVTNIEYQCSPNGTSPLALQAHAQCLCAGSYFIDWRGCQRCLLAHGARSDRDAAFYSSVLALASSQLCTGAPTAVFASLFTSAQAAVPYPTAGNTARSDVSSGDAAVSLYFTPTGSSGPGAITGSAALATATAPTAISRSGGLNSAASSTGSPTGATTGSMPVSTTAVSSTTRSSNVAAPTAGGGWWVAAAGGALFAAL